jgi:hypothetical protein
VDLVARFTHIWKTGVVVTALFATAVACGNSESPRPRNVASVAGTSCAKPGQISKISKVSVVCAKTITGNIWYPTIKSQGRSVLCAKPGAVRKKKSVVWVCGNTKGKKLWSATSALPPAVLQATAVVEPGVSKPVPVLESTNVATPTQLVVADNNVLANPAIPDEPPITTPSTIPSTNASAPETIQTVPEITTPTAPTSYKVGDTGPGGGKVFYVAPSSFTSTGSACGTACKYLEAAPVVWIQNATPAGQTNCQIADTMSNDPLCAWSDNTSTRIGTTGTGIGTGYANTSAMIAQSGSKGKAGTVARAFQGGGKTDWFLPSEDELNQMFVNKSTIGGFESGIYWSSSENAAGTAWGRHFRTGVRYSGNKANPSYVRPVRAFSTTTTPASVPSAPETIQTVPEITTPIAPTSYKVGDTGPGGGKVFYVAPSSFTSTGSACGTACKYLEAAPTGWIKNATPAGQTNCQIGGTISNDPQCAWSDNADTQIWTTGTGIGTGYANTSAMIAQSGSKGKAGTVARAFEGGGKTDWFLPSEDELNQMFVNKSTIGGFASDYYWSSSEILRSIAWFQDFSDGDWGTGFKANTFSVRPVRAF